MNKLVIFFVVAAFFAVSFAWVCVHPNAIRTIKFKKLIFVFRTSDEQEEEHGNVEKSYLVKYCNLYVTQTTP